MKIEKVNDNQIRCTLTRDDLEDRQLKISELAYGSEKTKMLFNDMMQQALLKFGFEANDTPLMVEAIPMNSDSIVLIITKVEDPEELDTRFSSFAPSSDEAIIDNSNIESHTALKGADDVLNYLKQLESDSSSDNTSESHTEASSNIENMSIIDISDDTIKGSNILDQLNSHLINKIKEKANNLSSTTSSNKSKKINSASRENNFTIAFSFARLSDVIDISKIMNSFYHGKSRLYKNQLTSEYVLALTKNNHTPEEFNKFCNIMSEHGTHILGSNLSRAHWDEHWNILIKNDAIARLSGQNSI